jgi:hypothetical protein
MLLPRLDTSFSKIGPQLRVTLNSRLVRRARIRGRRGRDQRLLVLVEEAVVDGAGVVR